MRRRIRTLSLVAAVAVLAAAGPTRAAESDASPDRVGWYCTRAGCTGASRSSAATVACFGAAVLLAGLVARRSKLRGGS